MTVSRNASWQTIEQNPGLPWDWYSLSFGNQSLTIDILRGNMDRPWQWGQLSMNTAFTAEDISMNADLPWCWISVGNGGDVTAELIESNSDKPWDWAGLSRRSDVITWDFVRAHADKPWDWRELSRSTIVTPEIILAAEHDRFPWDWSHVSLNPNVSYAFLIKHMDRPWIWAYLSVNPGIAWPDIQRGLEDPDAQDKKCQWDMQRIVYRKDIPWEFVAKHPDLPWDAQTVVNLFSWDTSRDIAAVQIQRAWRRANADPNSSLCRKRLMREHADMQEEKNIFSSVAQTTMSAGNA
jgi:hypothetical protein